MKKILIRSSTLLLCLLGAADCAAQTIGPKESFLKSNFKSLQKELELSREQIGRIHTLLKNPLTTRKGTDHGVAKQGESGGKRKS